MPKAAPSTSETPTAPKLTRRPLSIKIDPAIDDALAAYVRERVAAGRTATQKHTVIEHLLRPLLTEEGRTEITRQLEGRR